MIFGTTLLFISVMVSAAGYPYWYPKAYNSVGVITYINLEKREIVLSDAKFGFSERVQVLTRKSETNPLSILKIGDQVGVGLGEVVRDTTIVRYHRDGTGKLEKGSSVSGKVATETVLMITKIWLLDKGKPMLPLPAR